MTPGPLDVLAYLTRRANQERIARITRDVLRRRRIRT